MIGVHLTFVLPYVVGLQGVGLNRGRAMARVGPGESRFGPNHRNWNGSDLVSVGCLLE